MDVMSNKELFSDGLNVSVVRMQECPMEAIQVIFMDLKQIENKGE